MTPQQRHHHVHRAIHQHASGTSSSLRRVRFVRTAVLAVGNHHVVAGLQRRTAFMMGARELSTSRSARDPSPTTRLGSYELGDRTAPISDVSSHVAPDGAHGRPSPSPTPAPCLAPSPWKNGTPASPPIPRKSERTRSPPAFRRTRLRGFGPPVVRSPVHTDHHPGRNQDLPHLVRPSRREGSPLVSRPV